MQQDRPSFNPLEATRGLMVVCTDLEGRYTYANPAYLAYTGMKALLWAPRRWSMWPKRTFLR